MAKRVRSEWEGNLRFVLLLALATLILRSFVAAIFFIPSESMLPRLMIGDYLLVEKWPYGWSRWSLPWGWPAVPGKLAARVPARGDVVVFRSPEPHGHDVIKRVIGLPGDTIRMRAGQLVLNGVAVPKLRVGDLSIPRSPNFPCAAEGDGRCRFPRYRETLPGGRGYDVLDLGRTAADDTVLFQVPAGHVFLMGDNRDNSEDSRFSPGVGGMGYVPLDRIEGRAAVTLFATDGSAAWLKPWTWVSAARPGRIGEGF
ncbi:signal peptidase I [Sphingomonas bacterium]|uniref:signal peptidase I n=1 Tax=Sphingomonas bacterium TaxID=1895847 RepID=UPI001575C06A|nr:signal peptidase I [Sphingomonas bacterium]